MTKGVLSSFVVARFVPSAIILSDYHDKGFCPCIDILQPEEVDHLLRCFDEYEERCCGVDGISANGNERLKTHVLLAPVARLVRHPAIVEVSPAVWQCSHRQQYWKAVEALLGPAFVCWSSVNISG